MDAPTATRCSAHVEPAWDLDAWRTQARAALCANVPPDALDWHDADAPSLLAAPPVVDLKPVRAAPNVPRAFFVLATRVLAHRDPQRHALLYRLLWRIAYGEPQLLRNALDADVHRALALEKSVRRDAHKMKAFVRFRVVGDSAPRHALQHGAVADAADIARTSSPVANDATHEAYIAWFEPEHFIVDLVAPFFARRFTGMRWAILTPYRRALWDGESLHFGDGARFDEAPAHDAHEALWRAYYANIFNPARLNPRAMRQEMPVKYWRHLPETHQLPALMRGAGERVREMAERDAQPTRKPRMVARAAQQAATLEAQSKGLAALRERARACRACPLWEPATGTVFGEGPDDARIVVVGEQPGDQEDLLGRPFVGPAGQLFDRALGELGLDRRAWYVTNAVKHFKFEQRGKQRLHQRAAPDEQRACLPWLQGELAAIRAERIVCLGVTAAEAVLGRRVALLAERGQWHAAQDGTPALVTVHPAWVLRQRDGAAREAAFRGFVDDLALLAGQPVE
ncbi:UdgX family uracil-DNA binding protein [Cognatilysobacter bugurensis]|uniref:Type-4 uracil-DNA glycosylase n=1 Tax=Cognatilysobacter bugurensis TaxID=543356 RepID=A0A918T007_9GAMM|nr:UdgX family uracil-DNA binding protein [Lysobacter bugurensis]GHA79476.1 uracil-DNA glycosylase [Lysobacter bugurensis]